MTCHEALHHRTLQAAAPVVFVLLVLGVLWEGDAASAIMACGPLLIGLGG
jgi:hypothetical protein